MGVSKRETQPTGTRSLKPGRKKETKGKVVVKQRVWLMQVDGGVEGSTCKHCKHDYGVELTYGDDECMCQCHCTCCPLQYTCKTDCDCKNEKHFMDDDMDETLRTDPEAQQDGQVSTKEEELLTDDPPSGLPATENSSEAATAVDAGAEVNKHYEPEEDEENDSGMPETTAVGPEEQ